MIARLARSLPFYYGWVVVLVVFVTMALGVNARTAFSLLMPPMLTEFGWERGLTAGAFSFGFLISAFLSPVLGKLVDRYGPVPMLLGGVLTVAAGLLIATQGSQPWHIYVSLGVLVGSGSVATGYSGQSLYLPNWFVKRRGLAIGIAFSGVGVGSMLLLPWMQQLIESGGWRYACLVLGLIVLVLGLPLSLLVRRTPADLGLLPDGASAQPAPTGAASTSSTKPHSNIVDAEWAAIDWTLSRAARTSRFWWLMLGYCCMMYSWYAVQVHQTKYLIEVGFSASTAAWTLGAVSLAGIPGQIGLGWLSDRIGREPVFGLARLGFCVTYLVLLALPGNPSAGLLWALILFQGVLGYGTTAVLGAIPSELFEGKHFGSIFGTLMLGAIGAGALGPWLTGVLYDTTGNYQIAFALCFGLSVLSAVAVWLAAPRKVRLVAGQVRTN